MRTSAELDADARLGAEAADRSTLVRDGLAVLLLGLAAVCGVVLALPAEGRIAQPLHAGLRLLLGRAAFLLPVGLGVAAALLLIRGVRADVKLPWRRLVGLGCLAVGVLATEELLLGPDGAGLVGAWLWGVLLEWLGSPLAELALVLLLVAGGRLTFGLTLADVLRMSRRLRGARGGPTAHGMPVKVSPWVFAVPRWHGLGGASGPGLRRAERVERGASIPETQPAVEDTHAAG